MKPIRVAIDVPESRGDVYGFLDPMANHERFTDHMLRDWTYSGPPRGIGARARATSVVGGHRAPVEIEVVEARENELTVEGNVSSGGRRIGRGAYALSDCPGGGTHIEFTYSWDRSPLEDRVLAPVVRPMMRRVLRRSLERLRDELASREATVAGSVAVA